MLEPRPIQADEPSREQALEIGLPDVWYPPRMQRARMAPTGSGTHVRGTLS